MHSFLKCSGDVMAITQETDDLPLLGRDNRFFAGVLICAGLSFGLLVDREANFEG
jgi:hypothetical protein